MKNLLIGLAAGLLLAVALITCFKSEDPVSIDARTDAQDMEPIKARRADELQQSTAPSPDKKVMEMSQVVTPAASPEVIGNALPMPTRPEFDALFQGNRLLAAHHAAIEREPRDSSWAPAVEERFKQAFISNADLGSLGVPTAECRSTQCEIRLLAYGAPHKESMEWGRVLGQGVFSNSAAQVGGPSPEKPRDYMVAAKDVDGATVVVMHFTFSRDDAARQGP